MRFQQNSVEESATIWQRVELPRAKWPSRSCCVSIRWLILTTAAALLCSALLCSAAAAVLLLTCTPPLLSVPPPPFLLSPFSTAVFPSVYHFCCSQLWPVPPPPLCYLPLRTLLQVSECNWPSRQAPSLHNLFAVCKNMHNWLKQNPKNVCVITCSVRITITYRISAVLTHSCLFFSFTAHICIWTCFSFS